MFVQFTICAIIILLCWIVRDEKKRRDFVLPISFLAIIIFFAIRYDYGLDYWSYYNYYETGRTAEGSDGVVRGTGEVWFYYFMNFFPRFSYFIIAHTIIVFTTLFFITRKHLAPKFYPLFFFLILTMSVLSFNWISALRSTMAAVVLWIGIEIFYLERKRWLPFIGMVLIASFFHTSSLFFVAFPLIDFLLSKSSPFLLFVLLILGLISTMFFTERLYEIVFSSSKLLEETYEGHLANDTSLGYSIFGFIHNSILLFPYYYLVAKKTLYDEKYTKLYVLSTFIIILRCFKLDFHGRMSAILFIYTIFALAHILPKLKRQEKIICMVPLMVWCFYGIYLFYMSMVNNLNTVYAEGNYLFYHTIFEVTPVP